MLIQIQTYPDVSNFFQFVLLNVTMSGINSIVNYFALGSLGRFANTSKYLSKFAKSKTGSYLRDGWLPAGPVGEGRVVHVHGEVVVELVGHETPLQHEVLVVRSTLRHKFNIDILGQTNYLAAN